MAVDDVVNIQMNSQDGIVIKDADTGDNMLQITGSQITGLDNFNKGKTSASVDVTQAASVGYVNNVANGLDVKDSCKVHITDSFLGSNTVNFSSGGGTTNLGTITLKLDELIITRSTSAPYDGTYYQFFNGDLEVGNGSTTNGSVYIGTGDRILINGGTTTYGSANGIYKVGSIDATTLVMIRAQDADNYPHPEITPGAYTFIEEGAFKNCGFIANKALGVGSYRESSQAGTYEPTSSKGTVQFTYFSGGQNDIVSNTGIQRNGNELIFTGTLGNTNINTGGTITTNKITATYGSFTSFDGTLSIFASNNITSNGAITGGNLYAKSGQVNCQLGTFTNVDANTGTFGNVEAALGTFTNVKTNTGTFTNVDSGTVQSALGTFTNVQAVTGTFTNVEAALGTFTNVKANTGTFTNVDSGTVQSALGTFTNVKANTGTFGNVEAALGTFTNVQAVTGTFTNVDASGTVQSELGTFANLDVENGSFHTLTCNSHTVKSDKRLKTNFVEIQNPVESLEKITNYRFNWIKDNSVSHGVIAQELEEIMPELVKGRDDELRSVDYIQFIPMLIESVKDLNKEIKNLKSHLNI